MQYLTQNEVKVRANRQINRVLLIADTFDLNQCTQQRPSAELPGQRQGWILSFKWLDMIVFSLTSIIGKKRSWVTPPLTMGHFLMSNSSHHP